MWNLCYLTMKFNKAEIIRLIEFTALYGNVMIQAYNSEQTLDREKLCN